MIAILLLAIALAMDAFAVSIGLGAKQASNLEQHSSHNNIVANNITPNSKKTVTSLAVLAGVYFGVFQGVMPLIGYLFGKSVLGLLAQYAPYIACAILVILGAKMLYEAFTIDEELTNNASGEQNFAKQTSHKSMTALAIATSIDAMAAGFTLNLLAVNAWLACAIIGVVTAVLSAVGVYLGKVSGTWLESKAEVFGGLVLIGIGLKMVLV